MVNLSEMDRTRKKAAKILERIETARMNATRTTSVFDGIPRNRCRNYSKVENGSIMIADLEARRAEVLAQLEETKTELAEMLCSVDDANRRAYLRLRYLNGHKPSQIATACDVCERAVFRELKAGKADLARMFPDRFQEGEPWQPGRRGH